MTTRARRPPDRKAQIVAAAAGRFTASGYHTVAMGDIATDVGITAGALYKHFRNKQELLFRVIMDGLDAATEICRNAANVDDLLDACAAFSLDHRDLPVLWQREARALAPEQRREVRSRMRGAGARVAALVRAERPELSEEDAELLAWAALSVLASPSHHRVTLPAARFRRVLREMAAAVVRTRLPERDPRACGPALGLTRSSKREMLLTRATRLFAAHGFQAVTMEEIGAAAGMAGPSVYHHFASKKDLLVAILNRGTQVLELSMNQALARAMSTSHALDQLLLSYTDMAVETPDIILVLTTEFANLPEDRQRNAWRIQHQYIDEWARLLAPTAPAEARIRVHAALAICVDVLRTRHLRARPAIRAEVTALGRAVLGA
ncbi:TetR/AcrR family transcriptional regulator [Actinomadura roseirufa]|uniref:TetR/AcrR family transcriptional regulator n=1 Tax=Actinomadura roseirufa TaxID=2094049 RepID=UPI0013F17851|nr:TetR/AcrR family transcriptional regulator [Actinomadura roseirufa]